MMAFCVAAALELWENKKMNRKFDLWKGYEWNKKSLFNTYIWLCLFFIVLDQASKWIVVNLVPYQTEIALIPNFLYISHIYNTGVVFGLGDGANWTRPINIAISWLMGFAIFNFWRKGLRKENHFMNATLMLLEAGAIGNLIDRTFYWGQNGGPYGVIDWIDLYFGGSPTDRGSFLNPFANFNIADACITIGIILYIVLSLIETSKMTDDEAEAYLDENAFWRKKKKQQEGENDGKNN